MENAKTYFARSLLIGNTIELAGGVQLQAGGEETDFVFVGTLCT